MADLMGEGRLAEEEGIGGFRQGPVTLQRGEDTQMDRLDHI